jgi:hypothetical protein
MRSKVKGFDGIVHKVPKYLQEFSFLKRTANAVYRCLTTFLREDQPLRQVGCCVARRLVGAPP